MRQRALAVLAVLLLGSAETILAQSVDNPRVVTVSPDGSGADYSSLAGALGGVSSPSSSNRYVVLVYPGIYTGSNNVNLEWPSYVSLRGIDRASTIIKGSVFTLYETPLISFFGAEGVEVSNITLDGSAQMAQYDSSTVSGAIWVGDGSIRFNNVTISNGPASYAPGFAVSSIYSEGGGQITVENSQTGPIVDAGGEWTIKNTTIVGTSSIGPDYVYGYARYWSTGKSSIIASTIIAEATGSSVGDVSAIYVDGTLASPGLTISGSHLIARNLVSSPSAITAAVYEQEGETDGSDLYIEGSILEYQSGTGVGGGQFYGIYLPEETDTPLSVRASSIRGIGSGGTRADVYNDSDNQIALTAVEHSTFTGDTPTFSPDQRQGQFSSDLIVPLSSPTLGPLNGQVWIDTVNNKLCYQSGGSTRCVTGS
jgi:hypothetical protein